MEVTFSIKPTEHNKTFLTHTLTYKYALNLK